MKKLLPAALVLAVALIFTGCKKDDPEPDNNTPTTPTSSVFTFFKTGAT